MSNDNNLTSLLQRGLRVGLGATAALLEVLQDPQKRFDTLHKLQSELDQLAQEWAEKGETTEQEARNFVDSLLHQQGNSLKVEPVARPSPSSAIDLDVQQEIQELTAQITAIRTELEKLQQKDSENL